MDAVAKGRRCQGALTGGFSARKKVMAGFITPKKIGLNF